MNENSKPVPHPSPLTQPYWDGMVAGKLRIQYCSACGKARHYPRYICDACHSFDVTWKDSIRDILAVTDASPHPVCVAAPMAMRRLIGERIGAGFTRRTRELLGGAQGCTHLMELLGPAATTAFQSLVHLRFAAPDRLDAKGRPTKIDSCFAYGADSPVVKQRWPAHYTGEHEG